MSESTIIDPDAESVYDRQIRLWGREAQARLMDSHILLLGMSGTNVEVAKSLVLAGFNTCLVDDRQPTAGDVAFNFLLRKGDIGCGSTVAALCVSRLHEMNPLPRVETMKSDDLLSKDRQMVTNSMCRFDCILVAGETRRSSTFILLNEVCRELNKGFIICTSIGRYGYFFSDFHAISSDNKVVFPSLSMFLEASIPMDQKLSLASIVVLAAVKSQSIDMQEWDSFEQDTRKLVQVTEEFTAKCGQSIDSLIREICTSWGVPFGPSNAILGGLVAQEIRKLVTRNEEPLCNFVVFNGMDSSATVHKIGVPN